ncbi:MAG: hypothetical protein WAT39_01455 [Planctomycetota bacterium]
MPKRSRGDNLTQAQIDEIKSLVDEGMPVAWATESMGLCKQASTMRAKRNVDFASMTRVARGTAKINMMRRLLAIAEKTGQWQAFAWWLQRFGGALTPVEKAQLEVLAARAKALLATVDDGAEIPPHDPRFE